jgi:membrane-associated protease RseP (regulator of RpoE activity)
VWDEARHPSVTAGPQRPRVGSRGWVHLLLLVLTFFTMTAWAGVSFYANYITAVGTRALPPEATWQVLMTGGLWFSVPALLILGAHELGHYFACRYYRIPASLPYFIPGPTLVGTFGAVIRMAIPRTRRSLFDVGIAGPIAGFVVAVPVAIFGVSQSFAAPIPADFRLVHGIELGDPLLLSWLQQVLHGATPATHVFVLHPSGFAAWFGLLATALNLIPVGQLDGGHIVHALVGRRSRYVTLAAMAVVGALAVTVASTWIVWGVLLALMLWAFGLDHPPVLDEHDPIGRGRVWLGLLAAAMFALCFTHNPISAIDFLGGGG